MAFLTPPRELTILNNSNSHSFAVPVKRINEAHDVNTFLSSRAYHDIMTFLLQLNIAMFPRYTTDSNGSSRDIQIWELDCPRTPFSETVKRLRKLLDELEKILDEIPPESGPRRFGNASFKKWSEAVASGATTLLQQHLPADLLARHSATEVSATSEIESYFLGAFGSSQRLDYGTGHELCFLAFLGCIWKLGGFESTSSGDEERGIVLGIIEPYLRLVRKIIKTYTLEPAGSHGVWGLDDHSFVPYIFGSAQYAPAINGAGDIPLEGSRHGSPNPADVVKAVTVERERKKNMYFGAIGFIYDVKKGPFWEHSPILYDISGVPAGWAKINKGMIKMYIAEVLSKFPVVQHFRFGSLFSWDQNPKPSPPPISIQNSKLPSQVRSPKTSILSKIPHQEANLGSTSAPWVTQLPTKALPVSGTAAPWASRQPVANTPVISARKIVPRPVRNTVIEKLPLATDGTENSGTGNTMDSPS